MGSSLPQQADGLAANPQGISLSLLGAFSEASQPTAQWQWTVPYQNPLHDGDWEETVYALDGHGLVVGADVPLTQFASVISQAPAEAGSYPLLLDNATNQVIAVPPPSSTDQGLHRPAGGGQGPPRSGGQAGPGRCSPTWWMPSEARPSRRPSRETSGGWNGSYFVASVADPGWTLVDSVPAANFQPNVSALKEGINSALTSVFQGAVWIVAILLLVSFVLANLLSRFVVAPVRALTALGGAARRGPHRRGGPSAGEGRGR